MLQKKVCLIGSFAVGKTSLVRRFVRSIFDEKYLTTLGAKIDKKTVDLDDVVVTLVLWDLEGPDMYNSLKTSYLRGASGYLLVVDGTRRETLDEAMALRARVEQVLGVIPYVILINKIDLTDSWEIQDQDLLPLADSGAIFLRTSAKTGEGVERAFNTLARKMIDAKADEKQAP